MKTIICSHGFGVKADSRGMFTDIAAGLSEYSCRMFDYNDERANGDTHMRSLSEMAAELQGQIDGTDGEIVLLCHSLGCVVAGLADLSRVSKVVLLAPPVRLGRERFAEILKSRARSVLKPGGISELPRTDGSTTYLPQAFFDSVAIDPMSLYQKIADSKPTILVRATQDDIIGLTNVDEINNAQLIDLDSDHNFTGQHRQQLIDVLHMII